MEGITLDKEDAAFVHRHLRLFLRAGTSISLIEGRWYVGMPLGDCVDYVHIPSLVGESQKSFEDYMKNKYPEEFI